MGWFFKGALIPKLTEKTMLKEIVMLNGCTINGKNSTQTKAIKTLEIHKQNLFIHLFVLHRYKYLTILSSKLHKSNLARNFWKVYGNLSPCTKNKKRYSIIYA